MKKKIGLFAVAGLIALVSTPSMAQFAKAEDAAKYRGAAMALIGSHFGRMAPVAKKEAPYDKQKIQENIAVLNVLADLPWTAYGPGKEGGESRPEVWSDSEGFKQAQDKFKTGMTKLTAASDTGDFDAFRVAFGEVGKSCKSCHDSYRKKK
ncbi:cytochrome c [Candidimonas sp. SYP-B2681]|uniref:c-type cytochrome n=1 Tax=Candidimonas sp. SYP-B2681 TaxID=2497686 RepID=UPI000F87413C|nr:cytochrome c [Candidimonas sp. SYP-B2681]RTZ40935.1 cytochrome c [Candidimonas sp. SYP-B2681]